MTQEERQLLLQDLAARVPYGLKGQCEFVTETDNEFWSETNRFNLDVKLKKISENGEIRVVSFFDDNIDKESEEGAKQLNLFDFVEDYQDCGDEEIDIEDFKPYLRPMQTITDKEIEERNQIALFHSGNIASVPSYMDWLNEHHFDYRGLIQKGLAITAPERMYNTKNE